MIKFLKISHLLSLDVVLGAMISNIMFWKLNNSNTEIPKEVVIILGLSVWIIYILDRILDNKNSTLIATERHLFHQKYQSILWLCITLSAIVCAVLVFYIPEKIIYLGLTTALLTGIYLLLITKFIPKKSFQHYKEPIIALVYTAGVWGTANTQQYTIISMTAGGIFLLIAFQNLLLFSISEFKNDNNFQNIASKLGIKKSTFLFYLLSVMILSLSLYGTSILSSDYPQKVFIIEISMSLILGFIHHFSHFFLINERYRWVGDGIFLLPLFIIL
ncbi:MAG: hypothetical protein MUF58_04690 [Arcicella sp.]|nr:hypothetical protein [Arcicella sp.]